MQLIKIKSIKSIGIKKAYNITMQKNKNFLLGNGILTHNTNPSQQTLRALMEKYHKNARFILTGNYQNKIIAPIQSRCTTFEFRTLSKDDIKARLLNVLKDKNVKVDDNIEEQLEKVMMSCNFDVRKCVNMLQKNSQTGTFVLKEIENEFDEIIKLMDSKEIQALKEYVANNTIDYPRLFKHLIKVIDEPKKLLVIVRYYKSMHEVADPNINIIGLALEWN